MRPKRPQEPAETGSPFRDDDRLWMVIDPETREALRFGEGPAGSGPVFFSSEEALQSYCDEAGIEEYETHEVPASVLPRMKGKPFWLDAQPSTVEQAARRLRERRR